MQTYRLLFNRTDTGYRRVVELDSVGYGGF